MAMAARSIQISLDEELLRDIDRRPETRDKGRSAFIRSAIRLYLEADRRRKIDEAYARAYGDPDDTLDEYAALIGSQAWPEE